MQVINRTLIRIRTGRPPFVPSGYWAARKIEKKLAKTLSQDEFRNLAFKPEGEEGPLAFIKRGFWDKHNGVIVSAKSSPDEHEEIHETVGAVVSFLREKKIISKRRARRMLRNFNRDFGSGEAYIQARKPVQPIVIDNGDLTNPNKTFNYIV
jgi:hypothetical protein